MPSNANSLTQAILRTINSGIGCAWRNSIVAVRIPNTDKFRRSSDRTAIGTADIIACIDGKYWEIEVKAGRDRQSDRQKQHEHKVTAAGGVYIIIRTLDEFLTYAESFGWIKNGIRRKG